MRASIAKLISATVLLLTLGLALRLPANAACCIEGCGGEPSWTSCTNTSQCTGGVCNSPIGSAIAFDPDGVCGEGSLFSSCPPNEIGECNDGVNNDEWTGDVLTDCNDPDCAFEAVCRSTSVPVADGFGLAGTAIVLLAVGIFVLRSRLRA